MRPRHALPIVAALVVATGCGITTVTNPAITTPVAVDVTQVRQQLAGLVITPEGTGAGYSREKFPHWSPVSGACNTRETVLKRDGTNVHTGADCYPTSGTWVSPYDGKTWHKASDVDTDHLVPLAEAWRSGASGWTTARRKAFANDLQHPQLVTVTDNVNQAKGDQDPASWKPSLTSYWCAYAADWTAVKSAWHLTADRAEAAALDDMLGTCGGVQ